jgi:hypothetical protein
VGNLNLETEGKTPNYTLTEVVEKGVAKGQRKNNRQPTYLRYWTKLHSADWLSRPISEITRAMINDRHDEIAGNPYSFSPLIRQMAWDSADAEVEIVN